MTRVDQFESAFRAADKPVFEFLQPVVERALVVTDLRGADAAAFGNRVRDFLAVLGNGVQWDLDDGDSFTTIEALLERVNMRNPDLICTYRSLHSEAWRWPYSLGEYLDVLTQVAPCPVLVFPHPRADRTNGHTLQSTDIVMAITTHLAGDNSLVNNAAGFTNNGGTLWLAHVEDEKSFSRFMDTISKIDAIDTDTSRERILAQMLREPSDYIRSCKEVIVSHRPSVHVEKIVTVGGRLAEFRRLIDKYTVDLLVMYTKDADQSAMHGLAYPLAIELREIPLLLL
ncbi:MAG: hypothetical protein HOD33_00715 [Acidiferrobacteraceae bacterium]|nr:hypothetical protein [Acidiferrobacteraceae bacterium]